MYILYTKYVLFFFAYIQYIRLSHRIYESRRKKFSVEKKISIRMSVSTSESKICYVSAYDVCDVSVYVCVSRHRQES